MFDIFISYKATDGNGNSTEDAKIAKRLYLELTNMGLKVFYSAESLEKIGKSQYKDEIDNALDQAKVMIVVLTNPDYAETQWVKYEWDSFYNDYLSGIKPEANLFTLVKNINVASLPRTLRNMQSFNYELGFEPLFQYIKSIYPHINVNNTQKETETKSKFSVISGYDVSEKDIYEAILLDKMVYPEEYWLECETCLSWFKVNPDIYVMIKDNETQKVVAYTNVSPITDECYEDIKNGHFIDTGITADMILSYNMPFPYNIYFSSVVIHPDYQNTEVFMKLFNAIIERFITLGKQEVFIKRMVADAVSPEGEKFCKMFGMKKVDESDHNSTIYEVSLIPPRFRVSSRATKSLYDFYKEKYEIAPYLFE